MRLLIAFIILLCMASVGMILFAMRDTFPACVTNVLFIAQSAAMLLIMLLLSNWLRIYFQQKIDRNNARWYGHGRPE